MVRCCYLQCTDEAYIKLKRLSFALAYYFVSKEANVPPDDGLNSLCLSSDDDLDSEYINLVFAIDPNGNTFKKYIANLIQLRAENFNAYKFDFVHWCIGIANEINCSIASAQHKSSSRLSVDCIKGYLSNSSDSHMSDCETIARILCLVDIPNPARNLPFVGLSLNKYGKKMWDFLDVSFEGPPIYPKEIIDSGINSFPEPIQNLIGEALILYGINDAPLKRIVLDRPNVDEIQIKTSDEIQIKTSNGKLRYLGTTMFVVMFLGSAFAVLGENISLIFSNCHFPILNHGAYLAWNITFGIIAAGSFVIAVIRTLSTDKFQQKLCDSDTSCMKFLSLVLVGHADLQENTKSYVK
jgi:hypothetical protein